MYHYEWYSEGKTKNKSNLLEKLKFKLGGLGWK